MINKKQHRRIVAWRILGIVVLSIGLLFLLADLSRGTLSAAEFVFIFIGLVSITTSQRLKKIYTHPINTTAAQSPGLQPNPENVIAGVKLGAGSNLSSTTVASAQPQKLSQPAEVSAPASLLKNMTLLGSKKGSLKLTPNRLTFISSKNIVLMDCPLAEIVCQNKIFPLLTFKYLRLATHISTTLEA